MYPVSFEQEVLVGEKRAQDSGEEVVGSQVQRGGFHILSAFQLWQQILRRRYHRQSVAYVSHNLLTDHNKLRSGEQGRLGVATWHRKRHNSSKSKSKKGNAVCASFRRAFRALRQMVISHVPISFYMLGTCLFTPKQVTHTSEHVYIQTHIQ